LSRCYSINSIFDKSRAAQLKRQAIDALENAVKYGWDDVKHILKDDDLKPLKDEKRFKKIIQQMKPL
jgi:mannose/cellobiose epimerase-like protein (N-acyl-D-glucosamine 2-epimerase family)